MRRNKGQSTLEYAVIIAVVAAALLLMQIYFKRAVQGKMRESTDDIGKQYDIVTTSGSVTKNTTGITIQRVGLAGTGETAGTTLGAGETYTTTIEDEGALGTTNTQSGNENVGKW